MFFIAEFRWWLLAADITAEVFCHSWIEGGTEPKWVGLPSRKIDVKTDMPPPTVSLVLHFEFYRRVQKCLQISENISGSVAVIIDRCFRFHECARKKKTVIHVFHVMFRINKIPARMMDTSDGEHPPRRRISVNVDADITTASAPDECIMSGPRGQKCSEHIL